MNRRALTLFELLVVIGILLAIGAIALPFTFNRLDERAFIAGGDTLEQHLLLARAYAQRTGRPVQVICRGTPARLDSTHFDPDLSMLAGSGEGLGASLDAGNALDVEELFADGGIPPELVISESWASQTLAFGLTLTDIPPEPDAFDAFDAGPDVFDDAIEAPPTPIRIVVFLPDGAALLTTPVWLRDADGRQGMLTVNPWTGLPQFERGATIDPEAEAEEDEEDLDDLDDLEDDDPRDAADPSTEDRRSDRSSDPGGAREDDADDASSDDPGGGSEGEDS